MAFKSSLQAAQVRVAYLLVTPATLLLFLLLIGPLLVVFGLSFTDWQFGSDTLEFIGLRNYAQIFADETFRRSFGNTCIYTLVTVPLTIFMGLGVALLIESGQSLKKFYRAVFFLPVMTCSVAMAITWEFVLHPRVGLAAHILPLFGLGGFELLHNENTVLITLCGIGIWQNMGFNMVLFMAGLSGIPKELHEAAALDGAESGWSRFWLVTWPLLSPVTLFVSIITTIRSFQVFDAVHVLTQGGPNNASEVLIYTMFKEAFEFFRTGYASAITVIFLLCVLGFTLIKTYVAEKHVHYN
ncbi:sugar ABC transporter permease [Pseudodesulfovibrio thermohalotolerans]|uniref:carbohydrate ABC transporter permease n=1 Tax=Pseudodesulfovibrio thermohalotolerans TaxID=2880651 RepID=UPI002441CA3F|nr:sugar ABC transporter permease [Pseudodesulfovibrio thermohalotolerans]WFS60905.1 sugar ABC transporter permease [Pseudodesulfovibrio thermohalotolerans]